MSSSILQQLRTHKRYQQLRFPINKAMRVWAGYLGSARNRIVGTSTRPALMIVGAQKAGTTALHAYLCAHPQIASAVQKELHYFSLHYHHGADWYHGLFPARLQPGQITLDASPSYLYVPDVPVRIARYDAAIRLIVLLRNPIDRAFSAWTVPHWYKFGYTDFDQMVRGEIARIAREGEYARNDRIRRGGGGFVQRGLYAPQLERVFAHFPREQVLIFESSQLRNDPVQVMRACEAFMGLQAHDWSRYDFAPRNVTSKQTDERILPETRARLHEFYAPYNERLYALLGVNYGWS
jgi:hypothetical protein